MCAQGYLTHRIHTYIPLLAVRHYRPWLDKIVHTTIITDCHEQQRFIYLKHYTKWLHVLIKSIVNQIKKTWKHKQLIPSDFFTNIYNVRLIRLFIRKINKIYCAKRKIYNIPWSYICSHLFGSVMMIIWWSLLLLKFESLVVKQYRKT